MCIRKCTITALILFKGSECWVGVSQSKHIIPTLKERVQLDKYSILNIGNFFV